MSSMSAAPQFRRWISQPSNLDRCSRCGDLRSDHGPDWNCPAGVSHRSSTVLLIVGAALTATALGVHATVGDAVFLIQTAAFLVGVNLLVAGLITGGR